VRSRARTRGRSRPPSDGHGPQRQTSASSFCLPHAAGDGAADDVRSPSSIVCRRERRSPTGAPPCNNDTNTNKTNKHRSTVVSARGGPREARPGGGRPRAAPAAAPRAGNGRRPTRLDGYPAGRSGGGGSGAGGHDDEDDEEGEAGEDDAGGGRSEDDDGYGGRFAERAGGGDRQKQQAWGGGGAGGGGGLGGEDDGAGGNAQKPAPKSRRPGVSFKRPKLTLETLAAPEGLPDVLDAFPKGFAGAGLGRPGNEARDLRRLLELYERWQRRIFPYCDFAGFVDRLERLSGTMVMRVELLADVLAFFAKRGGVGKAFGKIACAKLATRASGRPARRLSLFSLLTPNSAQPSPPGSNKQSHLREMRDNMRKAVDLPTAEQTAELDAAAAAVAAAGAAAAGAAAAAGGGAGPAGAAAGDELDVDDDELLELQAAQMQEMVRFLRLGLCGRCRAARCRWLSFGAFFRPALADDELPPPPLSSPPMNHAQPTGGR